MSKSIDQQAGLEHGLALRWLLQAGFFMTAPSGTTLVVDAYLSDEIARLYGKRRIAEVPDAVAIAADIVLASHVHEDHFDLPWLRQALSRPGTVFVGPPSCVERLAAAGIEPSRAQPVEPGDAVVVRDVTVRAIPARHEVAYYPTPDAVGFLIEAGGVAVYHSGDTVYDPRIVEPASAADAALVCINGTEGNMDVSAAARLACELKAPTVVPMHFGLWADSDYGQGATLDPGLFEREYTGLNGTGRVVSPVLGEAICVRPHSAVRVGRATGTTPQGREGRGHA